MYFAVDGMGVCNTIFLWINNRTDIVIETLIQAST